MCRTCHDGHFPIQRSEVFVLDRELSHVESRPAFATLLFLVSGSCRIGDRKQKTWKDSNTYAIPSSHAFQYGRAHPSLEPAYRGPGAPDARTSILPRLMPAAPQRRSESCCGCASACFGSLPLKQRSRSAVPGTVPVRKPQVFRHGISVVALWMLQRCRCGSEDE